jgi:hypothetical protein
MLECFITAKLSRSSAPRAALQLQEPLSSGGFRETWSHCTHAHAWKCQAHARDRSASWSPVDIMSGLPWFAMRHACELVVF